MGKKNRDRLIENRNVEIWFIWIFKKYQPAYVGLFYGNFSYQIAEVFVFGNKETVGVLWVVYQSSHGFCNIFHTVDCFFLRIRVYVIDILPQLRHLRIIQLLYIGFGLQKIFSEFREFICIYEHLLFMTRKSEGRRKFLNKQIVLGKMRPFLRRLKYDLLIPSLVHMSTARQSCCFISTSSISENDNIGGSSIWYCFGVFRQNRTKSALRICTSDKKSDTASFAQALWGVAFACILVSLCWNWKKSIIRYNDIIILLHMICKRMNKSFVIFIQARKPVVKSRMAGQKWKQPEFR